MSITPEERAEWRADATRPNLSSCCVLAGQEGHRGEHRAFYDVRILRLLDALEAAEASCTGIHLEPADPEGYDWWIW